MKILCTSINSLPTNIQPDERFFALFKAKADRREGVGSIANNLKNGLKKSGFKPDPATWDFVQLCLAACAADLACPRSTSADGWTRVIDLTVGLHQPERWAGLEEHVSKMLKLLTGDHWTLHFITGGESPPSGEVTHVSQDNAGEPSPVTSDCVSLLSGGLDSLIGGIDLISQGRRPIFVSQLAGDDSKKQTLFAAKLGANNNHWQWNHGIKFNGRSEPSTRARSLAFYAFAVLAASRVEAPSVQIFIPENGFICINPPLVPGRVSSLSTKTTHPQFIEMMQELLNSIEVDVVLELPYRFKTKGQMLAQCGDQNLLAQVASCTTSCGRYRWHIHCGRCVPCIIRKAAFLAWGGARDETEYSNECLAAAGLSKGPDDAMAAALAVLTAEEQGLDRFLGATLGFADVHERPFYRHVLLGGLAEVEALLRRDGVL